MEIKNYDGPLVEKLKEFYGVYADRLEVAEFKSIQCPNYAKWHQKYYAYKTRPTDIWVVSYPKAGKEGDCIFMISTNYKTKTFLNEF